MKLTLTVPESGLRADIFLAGAVEGLTRSAAQRLLEAGAVSRGGRPVGKSERLPAGAAVEVEVPEPAPLEAVAEDLPLDVVYEDGDVIVVNKPVGMVVHPAPGHPAGTVVNALLYHCGGSLSGINGVLRPGIVHRIDRDTSGLLIAAKNDRAHLALAAQLQDHTLRRVYHGVVVGKLREDRGTVDAPLDRDPKERKRMAVVPGGREAVTHYAVLERLEGYTYAEFHLETGRTHQIRVHMAHLGHPLLGDRVYGSPKGYPGLAGQCLHAKELTFVHPSTGREMTVECPLPDDFTRVLAKLRRRRGGEGEQA